MLVAANKPLTTWVNVNLFQSAVVCIAVIAMCGCDQGQPADFFAATKKAAESGDAIAQANLGWMYQSGKGVPINNVEAYALFSAAAAGGYEEAVSARDNAAKQLTPEQLSEGDKKAAELFEKTSSGE